MSAVYHINLDDRPKTHTPMLFRYDNIGAWNEDYHDPAKDEPLQVFLSLEALLESARDDLYVQDHMKGTKFSLVWDYNSQQGWFIPNDALANDEPQITDYIITPIIIVS